MPKCPYCQNEMKRGFVEYDSRASIIWVEEGKERSILSKLRDKDCIVLAKRDLFNGGRVESNYCEVCNKVIIDVRQ